MKILKREGAKLRSTANSADTISTKQQGNFDPNSSQVEFVEKDGST